jgi:hypothetical protein
MNRGGTTIATSVARRGDSGSFAAGGGAASPINGDWVRDKLDPKLRQL